MLTGYHRLGTALAALGRCKEASESFRRGFLLCDNPVFKQEFKELALYNRVKHLATEYGKDYSNNSSVVVSTTLEKCKQMLLKYDNQDLLELSDDQLSFLLPDVTTVTAAKDITIGSKVFSEQPLVCAQYLEGRSLLIWRDTWIICWYWHAITAFVHSKPLLNPSHDTFH